MQLSEYTEKKLTGDPRHLSFQLARYKFVAKMIRGLTNKSVIEFGCGDGIGSLLISQESSNYTGLDINAASIKHASAAYGSETRHFRATDADFDRNFTHPGSAGLIFSLDVIEHLIPTQEKAFMEWAKSRLEPGGALIVGTPNADAARFQSPASAEAHINLHDHSTLLRLFHRHGFRPVFFFGMNDEVLHTGYERMCHYILMLGVNTDC